MLAAVSAFHSGGLQHHLHEAEGPAPAQEAPKRAGVSAARWQMAGSSQVAADRARREAACAHLLLKRFPVLASVSRSAFQVLMRTTRTRQFSSKPETLQGGKSDVLVREGEHPAEPVLMLIASGSVDVYMRSPFLDRTRQRHPDVLLTRLQPGEELNAFLVLGKNVDEAEQEHLQKRITYEASPYTLRVSPNSEHKDAAEAEANAGGRGALLLRGKVQAEKSIAEKLASAPTPHQRLTVYTLSLLAFRNLLCSQPLLFETLQRDILLHVNFRRELLQRNSLAHPYIGGFSADRTPFRISHSEQLLRADEPRDASPQQQRQTIVPVPGEMKREADAKEAAHRALLQQLSSSNAGGSGGADDSSTAVPPARFHSSFFDLHPGHQQKRFTREEVLAPPLVLLPPGSSLAKILALPAAPSREKGPMELPPSAFSFAALMKGATAAEKAEAAKAAAAAAAAKQRKRRDSDDGSGAAGSAAAAAAAALDYGVAAPAPAAASGVAMSYPNEAYIDPMTLDSERSSSGRDDTSQSEGDLADGEEGGYRIVRARKAKPQLTPQQAAAKLAARRAKPRKYVSPEEAQLRRYQARQRAIAKAAEAARKQKEAEKYQKDLELVMRRAFAKGLSPPPQQPPPAALLAIAAPAATAVAHISSSAASASPAAASSGAAATGAVAVVRRRTTVLGAAGAGIAGASSAADSASLVGSSSTVALGSGSGGGGGNASSRRGALRASPSEPLLGDVRELLAAARLSDGGGSDDGADAPPAPVHTEWPNRVAPFRRAVARDIPVQTSGRGFPTLAPAAAARPASGALSSPQPQQSSGSGARGEEQEEGEQEDEEPEEEEEEEAEEQEDAFDEPEQPSLEYAVEGAEEEAEEPERPSLEYAAAAAAAAAEDEIDQPSLEYAAALAAAAASAQHLRVDTSLGRGRRRRTGGSSGGGSSARESDADASGEDEADDGFDGGNGDDDYDGPAGLDLVGDDAAQASAHLKFNQGSGSALLNRMAARFAAQQRAERKKASREAQRRINRLLIACGGANDAAEVERADANRRGLLANGSISRRFSHAVNPELFSPAMRSALHSATRDGALTVARLHELRSQEALAHTRSQKRRFAAAADVALKLGLVESAETPAHVESFRAPGAASRDGSVISTSGGGAGHQRRHTRKTSSFLNHGLDRPVLRPVADVSPRKAAADDAQGGAGGGKKAAQHGRGGSMSTEQLEQLFRMGSASPTSPHRGSSSGGGGGAAGAAGGPGRVRGSVFKATASTSLVHDPTMLSSALTPMEAVAAVRRMTVVGAGSSVPLFVTPTRNSNGSILVNADPRLPSYAEFFGGALNAPENTAMARAQALQSGVAPDLLNVGVSEIRRGGELARRMSSLVSSAVLSSTDEEIALATKAAAADAAAARGGRKGSMLLRASSLGARKPSVFQRPAASVVNDVHAPVVLRKRHSVSHAQALKERDAMINSSPVNLLGFVSLPAAAAPASPAHNFAPSPVAAGRRGGSVFGGSNAELLSPSLLGPTANSAPAGHRLSFSFGSAIPQSMLAAFKDAAAGAIQEETEEEEEEEEGEAEERESAEDASSTDDAPAAPLLLEEDKSATALVPTAAAAPAATAVNNGAMFVSARKGSVAPMQQQLQQFQQQQGPVDPRRQSVLSAPGAAGAPTLLSFSRRRSNMNVVAAGPVRTMPVRGRASLLGPLHALGADATVPEEDDSNDTSVSNTARSTGDTVAAQQLRQQQALAALPPLLADHRVAGILAPTGSRLSLNTLHPWNEADWAHLRERTGDSASASQQRNNITLADIFQFQGLENDPAAVANGLGLEKITAVRATQFLDNRTVLTGLSTGQDMRGINALSIILHAFNNMHPLLGEARVTFQPKKARVMSNHAKRRERMTRRVQLRKREQRRAARAAAMAALADDNFERASRPSTGSDGLHLLIDGEGEDDGGAGNIQISSAHPTPMLRGQSRLTQGAGAASAAPSAPGSAFSSPTHASHGRMGLSHRSSDSHRSSIIDDGDAASNSSTRSSRTVSRQNSSAKLLGTGSGSGAGGIDRLKSIQQSSARNRFAGLGSGITMSDVSRTRVYVTGPANGSSRRPSDTSTANAYSQRGPHAAAAWNEQFGPQHAGGAHGGAMLLPSHDDVVQALTFLTQTDPALLEEALTHFNFCGMATSSSSDDEPAPVVYSDDDEPVVRARPQRPPATLDSEHVQRLARFWLQLTRDNREFRAAQARRRALEDAAALNTLMESMLVETERREAERLEADRLLAIALATPKPEAPILKFTLSGMAKGAPVAVAPVAPAVVAPAAETSPDAASVADSAAAAPEETAAPAESTADSAAAAVADAASPAADAEGESPAALSSTAPLPRPQSVLMKEPRPATALKKVVTFGADDSAPAAAQTPPPNALLPAEAHAELLARSGALPPVLTSKQPGDGKPQSPPKGARRQHSPPKGMHSSRSAPSLGSSRLGTPLLQEGLQPHHLTAAPEDTLDADDIADEETQGAGNAFPSRGASRSSSTRGSSAAGGVGSGVSHSPSQFRMVGEYSPRREEVDALMAQPGMALLQRLKSLTGGVVPDIIGPPVATAQQQLQHSASSGALPRHGGALPRGPDGLVQVVSSFKSAPFLPATKAPAPRVPTPMERFMAAASSGPLFAAEEKESGGFGTGAGAAVQHRVPSRKAKRRATMSGRESDSAASSRPLTSSSSRPLSSGSLSSSSAFTGDGDEEEDAEGNDSDANSDLSSMRPARYSDSDSERPATGSTYQQQHTSSRPATSESALSDLVSPPRSAAWTLCDLPSAHASGAALDSRGAPKPPAHSIRNVRVKDALGTTSHLSPRSMQKGLGGSQSTGALLSPTRAELQRINSQSLQQLVGSPSTTVLRLKPSAAALSGFGFSSQVSSPLHASAQQLHLSSSRSTTTLGSMLEVPSAASSARSMVGSPVSHPAQSPSAARVSFAPAQGTARVDATARSPAASPARSPSLGPMSPAGSPLAQAKAAAAPGPRVVRELRSFQPPPSLVETLGKKPRVFGASARGGVKTIKAPLPSAVSQLRTGQLHASTSGLALRTIIRLEGPITPGVEPVFELAQDVEAPYTLPHHASPVGVRPPQSLFSPKSSIVTFDDRGKPVLKSNA